MQDTSPHDINLKILLKYPRSNMLSPCNMLNASFTNIRLRPNIRDYRQMSLHSFYFNFYIDEMMFN